jgi:hypothetical protein
MLLTSVRQRRNRAHPSFSADEALAPGATEALNQAINCIALMLAGRWTVMPDASYQFEDFGLELRWAAASMRGMTGSSEVKPNQDAASCMAPLGPNGSTAFFGIFDGHGDGGEKPAAYAAQRVGPRSCTPARSPGSPHQ